MVVTRPWGIAEQTAAFTRVSSDPIVCGHLNVTPASLTVGGGAVGAGCWLSDSRLGRETKIGITSGGADAVTVTLPPPQSPGSSSYATLSAPMWHNPLQVLSRGHNIDTFAFHTDLFRSTILSTKAMTASTAYRSAIANGITTRAGIHLVVHGISRISVE